MSCPISSKPDPFKEAREKEGVLVSEFDGESVPMVLRHEELRAMAKDWQSYSSDAPMRISVPDETDDRTIRQLPFEIDPPDHDDYRDIVEPFFNRPKLPEVAAKVEALVAELIDDALKRESVEIVREFAVPLQSRGLAILLNLPDEEGRKWIKWGTHVFRDVGGSNIGSGLEAYLDSLIARMEENPGDDFFSALTRATFRGRRLTRKEMIGYGSVTFAGGRDTLIHSISGVIGHLAASPSDFEYLREDPKRIINAAEEFFRAISPVTHLTRTCPHATEFHGVPVPAGSRISLCFASANYDGKVFNEPEEVRLDRKPNPHVAFGFGPHLCLGAPHARTVVRILMKVLCEKVGGIVKLGQQEKVERENVYHRAFAFDSLTVRFEGR